jgi:protein-S-isoprenylcysteine O-methyltransferase Ste14
MYETLISIFWGIWIAYWLISSFNVKKNLRLSGSWAKTWVLRVAVIIAILILLGQFGPRNFLNYQPSAAIATLGVILCGLGLAFAIWARVHLGRNWSGVPSLKEDHELITSGPYSFVRHPIYTGAITALFGTALALGSLFWYIFFLAISIMFIWRIPVEEQLMMETFPNQYPEYKKRAKALIPFVW